MRSFMFFIWVGIAVGLPLGWLAKSMWLKFLASRDEKIKMRVASVAVRARVSDIPTESLVNELSTRDDILRSEKK